MAKRILLALLVTSAPAFAQPATPTVVEQATPPPANVAPWIARKGNLRLSITCGDTWVTPDDGLAVAVDGVGTDPQGINDGADIVDAGQVWNARDTGYLLAPGPHHVRITSPG